MKPGHSHIFGILLAIIFIFSLQCAWAAPSVGPYEVRIYAEKNFQGRYISYALTPPLPIKNNPDILNKMQKVIKQHKGSYGSIAVGKKAMVLAFDGKNLSGQSFSFIKGNRSVFKKFLIQSLVIYPLNEKKPIGIFAWSSKGKFGNFSDHRVFFHFAPYPTQKTFDPSLRILGFTIWGQETAARYGLVFQVGITVNINSSAADFFLPNTCMVSTEASSKIAFDAKKRGYGDRFYIRDIRTVPTNELKKKCKLATNDFRLCDRMDLGGLCESSQNYKGELPKYYASNLDERRGGGKTISIGLGWSKAVMLFERKNLEGRWKILRTSQNLSKDWKNRAYSYVVFPKRWPQPPGIHVAAHSSHGLAGGILDKFYIVDHVKDVYKIRLPKLPSSINDKIRWIDRSRTDIAFRVCTKENFRGDCFSYPATSGLQKDEKQRHFRTEQRGMRVVLNDPYWENVSSLEYWIIGGDKRTRYCIRTGDKLVYNCMRGRPPTPHKVSKEAPPVDRRKPPSGPVNRTKAEAPAAPRKAPRTPQLSGKWKTNKGQILTISQKGTKFSVSAAGLKGSGSLSGMNVTVDWVYKGKKGHGEGKVTKLNKSNQALLIWWKGGATWARQ